MDVRPGRAGRPALRSVIPCPRAEGLSTGDFEPVFRKLVGETAVLNPNTIVRLKQRWESEYRSWCGRMLVEYRYAYIWADSVYLGAGVDREKTALLCVVGAREDTTDSGG